MTRTGVLADPTFRTERARKAGAASQTAAGIMTRFLAKLPELSADQVETVRRALPPPPAGGGDDAT